MVRSEAKTGYLPSLDGWRAVAILGVMMTHDLPWTIGSHSNASFKGMGGFGVYLFFAISGFLITTRILEEEEGNGFFNIRFFYIRRLFRIQPAAWVYLAAIAGLTALGICHERVQNLLGGLLQYQNFLFRVSDRTGRAAFTGHFWTLAVEEHFYVILSLLLYFVRRRRTAVFASVLALLWMGQRWAASHGYYSSDVSERRTYWCLQYLMLPAMLAVLLRMPKVKAAVGRLLTPLAAFGLTLLLMVAMHVERTGTIRGVHTLAFLVQEAQSLIFGFSLSVIATATHPRSWSTRFLELPPMRFVGRLSYSLYLWHILFFVPVHEEVGITSPALLFLSGRPYKYLATAALALLSYYLVEKPLIRYGHRIAPPMTPGHRDLEAKPERVDLADTVPASS